MAKWMIGFLLLTLFSTSCCATISDTSRSVLYLADKKAPFTAAALDLFTFPFALGHAYTGEWTGGLLFDVPIILAFAVSGAVKSPGLPTFAAVVGVVFLGAQILDGYNSAERFNSKLKEKLGVNY